MAKIEALGGEEIVLERIANGETLAQVAEVYGVGRYVVWHYLNKAGGDARKAKYRECQRIAAGAFADESLRIADDADDIRPQGVQKAKLRSDARRWLASIYDREQFGQKSDAQVQFNIGELHLQALQKFGGPDAARIPEGEATPLLPEPVDAEVIE